jgi:hypothetical protein
MDKAMEAAWLAGGIALHEHAPDLGMITRTAIVQVVCEAAIPAYVRATPAPTPSTDIAGLVGLPWRELDGDIYDVEDRIIAVTVDGGNDGNAALIVNAVNAIHGSTEPVAELVRRLLLIADDPMWADHAEISKALLRLTATALQRVAQERNAANATISALRSEVAAAERHALEWASKAGVSEGLLAAAQADTARWIARVSEIREASGLGGAPMLTDLAEAIRGRLSSARDEGLEMALEPFAADRRHSLGYHGPVYGDDDPEPTHNKWVIWREEGNINDREWVVVASGDTPAAAILALKGTKP